MRALFWVDIRDNEFMILDSREIIKMKLLNNVHPVHQANLEKFTSNQALGKH